MARSVRTSCSAALWFAAVVVTAGLLAACGFGDGLERLDETMPEELGGQGKAGLTRDDLEPNDRRLIGPQPVEDAIAGGWERYTSETGRYSADLPGEPAVSRSTIDGRTVWTWSAADGDDVYRISEFELEPGRRIDDDAVLGVTLDGLLEVVERSSRGSASYSRTSPRDMIIGDYDGQRVEANVEIDGEPVADVYLLSVMAGRQIIQLAAVDIDRDNRSDGFRFLDSIDFAEE